MSELSRPPKDVFLYRCPNGHVSHVEFGKGAQIYFGLHTKMCMECMKLQARKVHADSSPVLMTRIIDEVYYSAYRLGGIEAVKDLVRSETADGT